MSRIAAASPEVLVPSSRAERVASVLCGLAFAGVLFAALSLSRSLEKAPEEDEVYTARQVVLPVDTPPPLPPRESTLAEALPLASPIQLEIAASASPVHLVVPGIPVLAVDHEMPMARPEISARFDLARSAARPVLETAEIETRRVFERYEVDQPPMAIDRVRPQVTATMLANNPRPRTVMLLIVNTDGTVGDVQLLQPSRSEELDEVMMATIRRWRFSPAVRKNRKVRCWVQQSITVQVSGGSPFELN